MTAKVKIVGPEEIAEKGSLRAEDYVECEPEEIEKIQEEIRGYFKHLDNLPRREAEMALLRLVDRMNRTANVSQVWATFTKTRNSTIVEVFGKGSLVLKYEIGSKN